MELNLQTVIAPQMQDNHPERAIQELAFEHVSHWLKKSKAFMDPQLAKWRLLSDLYHNRLDLKSWSQSHGQDHHSSEHSWQSDMVLSPSYIVDTWADRAYKSIFSGPEWLTVIPEVAPWVSNSQAPLSFKLQELLLRKLTQGQIHVRMYEVLQSLILYGSVYAKVFWFTKHATRQSWGSEFQDTTDVAETIYDCPIIQVIPFEKLLVDWTANHHDIQRHTGIGHCVNRSYFHLEDQFRRGIYSLNREEFEKRWGVPVDGSQHADDRSDQKFTIWEWHGILPTNDGPRECMAAILTEEHQTDPGSGILIRLTTRPPLWCGLRPFLSAHYIPQAGPLGVGAIESNLDLVYAISQFLSQSQDNARLTANAQLIVRRGSSVARQIETDGDVVFPGRIWAVDEPDDIRPFPPLQFPQNEVNFLIDYLNRLLEKRTAVNELSMGLSANSRTATEAHILQESSSAPFSVRTDLFARSFLEPLGKLALSMMQQFIVEDQVLMVDRPGGQTEPIVVATHELQSGKYRVAATLTTQDSTKLARAQSIERALPTLAKFQPLLSQEGISVSFHEILKRYLDMLGIDGSDRVLKPVSAHEQDLNTAHPDESLNMPNLPDPEQRDVPDDDLDVLVKLLQKQALASSAT